MNLLYGQSFKSTFLIYQGKKVLYLFAVLFLLIGVEESYGFGEAGVSGVLTGGAAFGVLEGKAMHGGSGFGVNALPQLGAPGAIRYSIDPKLKELINSMTEEESEADQEELTASDEALKVFQQVKQESPYTPSNFIEGQDEWVVMSGSESFICQQGQITDLRISDFPSVDKAIHQWDEDYIRHYKDAPMLPGFYVVTSQLSVSQTTNIGLAVGMEGLKQCLDSYSMTNQCVLGRPVQHEPGGKGGGGNGGASQNKSSDSSTPPCTTVVAYQSPATNLGGGLAGGGDGEDPNDPRNWQKIKTTDGRFYIHPNDEDELKRALGRIEFQYLLGRLASYSFFGLGYYWPVSYIPRPLYNTLRDSPGASAVCAGGVCAAVMMLWQSYTGRSGAGFFLQGAARAVPFFGFIVSNIVPRGAQAPMIAGVIGYISTNLMAKSVEENETGKTKMLPTDFFPKPW